MEQGNVIRHITATLETRLGGGVLWIKKGAPLARPCSFEKGDQGWAGVATDVDVAGMA